MGFSSVDEYYADSIEWQNYFIEGKKKPII